jgi:GNAT superfamily N-acetyltransferase
MATDNISLAPVTQENWRAALRLAVHPDQQRFVAEYAPVVAVALAKAYLRLGDLTWAPYAISAGAEMVGFVALAYEPASADDYWVFHFFIDQRYQGRGYARAALERLLALGGGGGGWAGAPPPPPPRQPDDAAGGSPGEPRGAASLYQRRLPPDRRRTLGRATLSARAARPCLARVALPAYYLKGEGGQPL